MLSELLRRGPSARTLALLYAAVVVVAVLVVASVLPTTLPESTAADHRLLPEYRESKSRYETVIKEREQAVEQELNSLYDEATRSKNASQTQFWVSQKSSWEIRKTSWNPREDWQAWFPGVEFPERLNGILQQYEKRYFDAAAMLKDEYEKLARDLVRRGQPEMAEAVRAEAFDRWGLVDLRPPQPNEDRRVQVVQVPPPPEPAPIGVLEPEVVEPIPPVVVETPGAVQVAQDPPPRKKRFIDLNSFECRESDRRERLIEAFGGSAETEAAVARALKWLASHQQREDGLWSLKGPYPDGAAEENHVAATAMALLAFQGAGNTTVNGPHSECVRRGWSALLEAQDLGGRFGPSLQPPTKTHHCYAQALATIALCELVGMTKNDAAIVKNEKDKYAKRAQRALDFAVQAQGPNGGWRYELGQPGDMSVTAWYMAAFKAAQIAGLQVPPETLRKMDGFLETVAVENGSLYGYLKERPNAVATPVTVATSAAGLLCRQQRGWRRDNQLLAAGIQELVDEHHLDRHAITDAYACYSVTQVAHHMGGATWQKWNTHMKEVLPAKQVPNVAAVPRRAKGKKVPQETDAASWDPTHDRWGNEGGRLFVTCFCTYMLQVYYRYPPIYESRLDECGLP